MRSRVAGVADTLAIIGAHLPRELVDEPALRRAAAACSGLPAVLTKWIYFECRLRGSPRVDLVLEVDRVGRSVLAGDNPAVALPARYARTYPWNRVCELCAEWGRPEGQLARAVHHIWLELDVPVARRRRRSGPAAPGVFVCFGETAPPAGGAAAWLDSAREAVRCLTGARPEGEQDRALARCFARLPHGAHVPYVGVMLQRPGRAIRLCVRGLTRRGLLAYLEAIGWPGPLRELEAVLAGLGWAQPARRVGMLHVDVGDGVHPRLGFEYALDRKAQLARRLREQAFLNRLVRRGLCSAAKRDALGAWPGATVVSLPHQLWRTVVQRRVNHVKIVYEPGRGIVAKAYLCAALGARNRRGVVRFERPGPCGAPAAGQASPWHEPSAPSL